MFRLIIDAWTVDFHDSRDHEGDVLFKIVFLRLAEF
jgi:hypothetical protein